MMLILGETLLIFGGWNHKGKVWKRPQSPYRQKLKHPLRLISAWPRRCAGSSFRSRCGERWTGCSEHSHRDWFD